MLLKSAVINQAKNSNFYKTHTIFKLMPKSNIFPLLGNCSGTDAKINIHWKLYVSQCAESFSFLKVNL